MVAVETLAIAIRQNSMIKGITIDKKETKLLQYADDTTAVLSDINSAQTLFKLLDDFKKFSGLEVNPTKTEGMWIGSSRENKTKPFGIKWPNEPIKALGVYYSYDQKLLHEKNLIENLDSVKKLINIWSARGQTVSLRKGNNNKISDCPKICLCIVIINYPQGGYPRTKPIDF